MTDDLHVRTVLTHLAAQLALLRADRALKQAASRLAKNTVHRMEHGHDYRVSSLVILAEDYGYELVITFQPKAPHIQ